MIPKLNGITILMRHGHTEYLQGNVPVPVAEAYDLNEQGIEEVTSSSSDIAEIMQHAKSVTIYTSPMGRAIHTAKILEQHLLSPDRKVRLICAMELQEVHNFDWGLFSEAVRHARLDAATRPTDDWFALDPFKDKTEEILNRLPPHLRDFVLNLETASDSRKRLLDFINSVAETDGDKVFITHDGLLCGLLRELSAETLFTCTRSHYFELLPSKTSQGITLGRNNLGYRSNNG